MKSLAALLSFALLLASRVGGVELVQEMELDPPNVFNEGVVLAYAKGTTPEKGKEVTGTLNDSIVIRVRNLDGWLIRQLKNDRITGAPAMSKEQRSLYLELHAEKADLTVAAYLDKRIADGTWDKKKAENCRDSMKAYWLLLEHVKSNLYPVVNGSRLKKCRPDQPKVEQINKLAGAQPGVTVYEFSFPIRRFHEDVGEWNKLYDGPRGAVPVSVSLGVELDNQFFALDSAVHPLAPKDFQRFNLQLYKKGWLLFVGLALVFLFVALLYLGKNTDLLRDRDLGARADGRAQFSLARVQLAFWTYLVVGAFLIIWLVTDRLDTLNPTVLGLLGISSATLLASKLANTFTLTDGQVPADPQRTARAGKDIATLDGELTQRRATLADLAVKLDADPAATDEQKRHVEYQLEQTDSDRIYLGQKKLARFWVDLLSENGRLSMHRMQIAVWTLVLGLVFVVRVKRELAMPIFDDTLLGLMGLSAATYVALKIPELKKTEAQANANRKPPAGGTLPGAPSP